MDHIKAEKRAYIVLSVVQFVLGAYLIARPEQSFSIACYAIGTVLVVYAAAVILIQTAGIMPGSERNLGETLTVQHQNTVSAMTS